MLNIEKYQEILKNIEKAGKKTKIIAISKNHPKQAVEEAISCGVNIFGENRVQEARFKFEELVSQNKSLQLHLTGPLQTNKVKQALNLFSVFHTLDREKLLIEFFKNLLSPSLENLDLHPFLQVFFQPRSFFFHL